MTIRRTIGRGGASLLTMLMALVAYSMPAAALPPDIGTFPVGGTEVLQPESSMCGFDILWTRSGEARYQVFFDADGNPTRVHVKDNTTGTLSANGVTVRTFRPVNQFEDIVTGDFAEVGIVFQAVLPGYGLVSMERGRLVFHFDPVTGESLGVTESGQHPQFFGDIGDFCEAFS